MFYICFFKGASYLAMLEENLVPAMRMVEGLDILQQDGARPHRTNDVFEYLDNNFPGRWIGKGKIDRNGRDVSNNFLTWPPYSPDLTPPDFFLWSQIKRDVDKIQPQNREDMIEAIENAFAELDPDMIKKTCRSVTDRFERCRLANGNQMFK